VHPAGQSIRDEIEGAGTSTYPFADLYGAQRWHPDDTGCRAMKLPARRAAPGH
jgi:hypothetical protein